MRQLVVMLNLYLVKHRTPTAKKCHNKQEKCRPVQAIRRLMLTRRALNLHCSKFCITTAALIVSLIVFLCLTHDSFFSVLLAVTGAVRQGKTFSGI